MDVRRVSGRKLQQSLGMEGLPVRRNEFLRHLQFTSPLSPFYGVLWSRYITSALGH